MPFCCYSILWLEKSVKSKRAKLTFVRMHEQMAASSPPQKEQTAAGKEGEEVERERESFRDVDLQLETRSFS